MKEQLEQLKAQALAALQEANTPAALDELRVRFLGKTRRIGHIHIISYTVDR